MPDPGKLATVEKYSEIETLAWRIRIGDFYGVPCYEIEAQIKADAINAAAQDLTRKAMEEFRESAARFHKRSHLEECRCKRCREAEQIRSLPLPEGKENKNG